MGGVGWGGEVGGGVIVLVQQNPRSTGETFLTCQRRPSGFD